MSDYDRAADWIRESGDSPHDEQILELEALLAAVAAEARSNAFAELASALRGADEAQLPVPGTYEHVAVFVEKYAALDIAGGNDSTLGGAL